MNGLWHRLGFWSSDRPWSIVSSQWSGHRSDGQWQVSSFGHWSLKFDSFPIPIGIIRHSSIPFRLSSFVFCLSTLLLAAAPLRADWTLTTADGLTRSKVTPVEWNLKDALAYTDDSGKVTSLPTRQVVTLDSGRKAGISEAPWILTLRNGDILFGSPTGLRAQFLQYKVDDIGSLEVPLKAIATLQAAEDYKLSAPPRPPAAPPAEDLLLLRNGDVVSGVFLSTTDEKIQMQIETGPVTIDLSRVRKLTLGGTATPRALPPLSACVAFANGSRLTTTTLHWTPDGLTFTDPAGQERKAPPEQAIAAEILGGRLVWLDQLDPAKDQQVSLLNTSWPTQINHNAAAGPLKIARETFARGLGVHTQSTLVYDLDGSFATLTLRCGLDDSAAPTGTARPSIVLDGKVLWAPKDGLMKVGDPPETLTLNITGGKKLELHADPGPRFDILGRFDWIAPALIRP